MRVLSAILGCVETAVTWLARPLRIALGYVWSAILLLCGLWLWDQQEAFFNTVAAIVGWWTPDPFLGIQVTRSLAVFAIAAAQFVFMFLVADDLCPNVSLPIREFLEFFSSVLAVSALLWASWLVWTHVL